MANDKYKFYNYFSPYKDNEGIKQAGNDLLAVAKTKPSYSDSYADEIHNIYNEIKSRPTFAYNPNEDAVYRQYADQYRALNGLAIAGNQAQAQELTGGYGSTYAPEVARQGLTRLNANVENAQPAFYMAAQNAYDAEGDRLNRLYSAASAQRQADIDRYAKESDLYNQRYNFAASRYNTLADRGYDRYINNRDYKLQNYNMKIAQQQADKEYQFKVYETYNALAANKCADFNEKKNNKGMKAYLQGLVKEGKLTQYMADQLYKQYKYVAPKSGGGGGGRRGGGGGGRRLYGGGGGGGDLTVEELKENGWFPTSKQIIALGFGSINKDRFWSLYKDGYIDINPNKKTVWTTTSGKNYLSNQKKPTLNPFEKTAKKHNLTPKPTKTLTWNPSWLKH